jgi:hypothetical protein
MTPVLLAAATVLGYVLHACFDREAAGAITRRWKPAVVAGAVLSHPACIGSYTKARILLTADTARVVGCIVSEDGDAFVVSSDGAGGPVCVEACLWRSEFAHRADAFRNLRDWAEQWRTPPLRARLHGIERQCWRLASR